MPFTYAYPRSALTVDCVVFGIDADELNVLLIRRALPPFEGSWALPGGFVGIDETLEDAARRELEEETGLSRIGLEQFHTFGAVDRDPRERVVSVAHCALVNRAEHAARAATDAGDAAWFDIRNLPNLAFDHDEIIATALRYLRSKPRNQPIGLGLLPEPFTLAELRRLYEVVLERPLDEERFRARVLAMNLLVETDRERAEVAEREAGLYCFDEQRYRHLVHSGFDFEL